MKSPPKYSEVNLIPIFRKAADFRNEMLSLDFTDNGGAIHSAERILDILGQRLKYPGLSHINNYKKYPNAEFSEAAWKEHENGKKVLIEHVSPIRAFTRKAIKMIGEGATDEELKNFVKNNYRLVLLTPDETMILNKQNRSQMAVNRLEQTGIIIATKVVTRKPVLR